MPYRRHFMIALLAVAAAGAAFVITPAPAQAAGKTVYLPGVKGYNFKASPNKIRRLCINFWKGRFWYQKPFYGCDGVKFRWRHWRVDCHLATRNCVISMRAPTMGPDGADDRRERDRGENHGAGYP